MLISVAVAAAVRPAKRREGSEEFMLTVILGGV
jgi:hypothetical protein